MSYRVVVPIGHHGENDMATNRTTGTTTNRTARDRRNGRAFTTYSTTTRATTLTVVAPARDGGRAATMVLDRDTALLLATALLTYATAGGR